ncbi:MAG: hypothetical protein PHC28_16335 [Flavobacterium sp.]|uniref:hypothetical protein n=1 Tax=Flavobacterium sp. TaxID=239 RepID=UPI0026375751|nr:hypothetical protein [Flavobacterium sp.]MDD5152022.1 hypothetical protein [Flavobacterium sp.]
MCCDWILKEIERYRNRMKKRFIQLGISEELLILLSERCDISVLDRLPSKKFVSCHWLNAAFTWASTPEGYWYWVDMRVHLLEEGY